MTTSLTLTEAIALRMKQLAHERHATLNEIIKRSDLHQSTISEIIQGRSKHPRVSTIQKFSRGCGITIKDFFDSPLFDELNEFDELYENTSTTQSEANIDNVFEFAAKMPPQK